MKVVYEAHTDVATIYFVRDRPRVESHLVDDDIVVDLAEDGRLVAVEIIGASERLDLKQLQELSYEVDDRPPVRLEDLPARS